ncbi:LamB/YcsF family protein [Bosea vestrisii]|uniref:LamB/YcsF family protein n=1 Tax=Bosea vestrisii TaxID=151416 RepID=UPI003D769830
MKTSIDLNSDMGEAFGAYRLGDDEAILDIVSSANVACGFHAGDPEVMANTFRTAREKGVTVGAHPGFADLWGFGRRVLPHTTGEIERLTAYQVGAAQALSAYSGNPITYVKAHGALGNLTASDPEVAKAVTKGIKAVDPKLICLVIALGEQERIARDLAMEVRSEIFADRAYTNEGMLMSRKLAGSVLTDATEAADRVVRMIRAGAIETASGRLIEADFHSICLHSDTPQAVSIGLAVRGAVEAAGISIEAFAPKGRP